MAENTENLLTRAEHLVEIDRWQDALQLLSKALARDPSNFRANALTALSHYQLRNYRDSVKFAEEAIKIEPEEEWGHRIRSLAMSELGDRREALRSAEEAARLAPYEPFALNALATVLIERNKTKRALEVANQMIEIAPEVEQSHFTLGNVYLKQGRNWEAEKAFREALRINPNSADARNNLGVALLRQEGNSDGLLSKAVSLTIFSKDAFADKGGVEENFHEALKIEPGNELAAENLRSQYSYTVPFVLAFAFIPFMILAFSVIPFGAVLMFIISLVRAGKFALDIAAKRRDLSPEMVAFVKGGRFFGEQGSLDRIASSIWAAFLKTWKPHSLALVIALVNSSQFIASGMANEFRSGIRAVCTLAMIFAAFWLASESRKGE